MSAPRAIRAHFRSVPLEVQESPPAPSSVEPDRVEALGAQVLPQVGESPVRCSACGGPCNNVSPWEEWELFGGRWTLVACTQCQSLRTHPMPGDEVLNLLYGSNFNYDWYRHHYPAKLLDSMLRLLSYRARGWLEGERLLDFGGGVGYFSTAARLAGYEAHTYDPMLGSGQAPAEGSCDTLVAHHVLEHSNNLDKLMSGMVRFVRPEGLVVVAVPNALGAGYRTRGSAWAWSQPPLIHIHHFSERGLVALLERHGLRVQQVSFHERWDANLLSDLHLVRLFERLERQYGTARRKRWVALRNSALRFGALAASTLYQRTQPSAALSELLVVARRAR